MLAVGLTGGIGSGKSLVSKIFEHFGVPVFNADNESKAILLEDEQVRKHLTQWLGPDIYTSEGPDRQKIARMIFTDPCLLNKVNGLIHPLVIEHFKSWCQKNKQHPYVIQEAAILFETGLYQMLDFNILVVAPEQIRIERVKSRDQVSTEAVEHRMKNQWLDEQKIPLADYIINNDGESPLLPQVLEIHKNLKEK